MPKDLIKGNIGRMVGKKLYNTHYTLLGRIVYHICKLETKQLQNMVNNVVNLSKVKRNRNTKTKRKKSKKKPTAKQLRARKLFAMRVKRGDFKR
jgi:folate-dependent tRNA-U54 methylase TrmFO/GidA